MELPMGDGEVRFNHNDVRPLNTGRPLSRGEIQRVTRATPAEVEAIQRELNVHPTWREGDPCQVCGEPETGDDPIAHFVDDRNPGQYVMAHGQCGLDAGLRLA